jgi:hypothetical protein
MLLYNVTFHVALEVVEPFRNYLEKKHLPEIQESKAIIDYKLLRLLQQDETEAVTFALQYFLHDAGTYHHHISVMDVSLKTDLSERFGENVLYFCTLMETI